MIDRGEIERIFWGKIKTGICFKDITSMGVGGSIEVFLPLNVESDDIEHFFAIAEQKAFDWICIGDGTNIIANDTHHNLIVVKLIGERLEKEKENSIISGASVRLSKVVDMAKDLCLTGMEPFYGIPGTVGGAARMNAGTREYWMDRVIDSLEIVDLNGRRWVDYASLNPSYRTTAIEKGTFVTRVRFGPLKKDEKDKIEIRMREYIIKRIKTQPRGVRCSGSIFKNPPGDSAGRLIEICGLKGKSRGGASISEIHANFIVNHGNATFGDIMFLIDLAKERVFKTFGIELKEEVVIIK